MVYKFFDRESSGSGIANEPNCQLANELQKQLFENLKKENFIHLLGAIFRVFI